ncbi:MAG: gamma carbonic anhydrase family protein [Nitrososphaerota archaeon]
MPIMEVLGKRPTIHPSAYIAKTAWIIGDVKIASGVSIWFNSVLRAEGVSISIGSDSNVRDGSLIHPDSISTVIGERVSIGHGCRVEGVYIADEVLIGSGAIVLEGARIGRGSLISAGSVLPAGSDIPEFSLVMGNPARIVGRTDSRHKRAVQEAWNAYSELANSYRVSRIISE